MVVATNVLMATTGHSIKRPIAIQNNSAASSLGDDAALLFCGGKASMFRDVEIPIFDFRDFDFRVIDASLFRVIDASLFRVADVSMPRCFVASVGL